MKISYTFTLLIILFVSASNAFTQTIPNGSFENWAIFSNIEEPNGWTTSQSLNCTPLSSSKTTDHSDSSYAILLETANCTLAGGTHEGFAIASFPISIKPFYLNGAYKTFRNNTDSAQIKVFIKNGTTIIGTAKLNIFSTTNTYTNFSIPITYNSTATPNGVSIQIFSDRIGFSVLGNKLWVDQLTFSSSPLFTKTEIKNKAELSISPNPCLNEIIVSNTTTLNMPYSIFDNSGREVLKGQLSHTKSTLQIEKLASGIYFLKIENNLNEVLKFIKQ
jgi:hypothetical protein